MPTKNTSVSRLKALFEGDGKVFGYDWTAIQGAQQGHSLAGKLTPIDKEKRKTQIEGDMRKFKISVAKVVADQFGIEIPSDYILDGDNYRPRNPQ